jgi:hypothetical protein
MTDDLWWAFIASIDKQQLLRELPGSPTDRRMREQHAAHVAELKADRAAHDLDQGPRRRADAVANSAGWTVRYDTDPRRRTPATPIEREIAAYAARKRGHAA